ncbi:MAG: rRNA maturation RNase YbeY [Finegoldia magna]|uniref:rRNA maturation RNase YbeY n=3 Tax=Peptoniphilaceae TaxID=1570339 RepID=UPI002906D2BC|nr:rRNA maturation RNase YbeY [Finegoldia magna]MDU7033443.1 rRNA maturation RNase YbeY [Finegoldia magna]
MIIQTSNRQEDFQIDDELTSDIEKSIRICLLQELNDDNYEISLSFVSEAEIRKLNRDYRDKDSVTDVLSFPLDDDFAIQTNLLGDIIICCKRAIEQAKEYNHSIKREIVYLVVHSMFHLLGYDHIDESDRIIMRNKEKSALKEIGIYKDEEFRY